MIPAEVGALLRVAIETALAQSGRGEPEGALDTCLRTMANAAQTLEVPAPAKAPRFAQTSCSQCGEDQGPGDSGFSHCSDHAKPRAHLPGCRAIGGSVEGWDCRSGCPLASPRPTRSSS